MKKLAFITATVLALGVGVVSADTMENGFANTFVATNAEGMVASYHFNADHTFTVMAGETRGAGVWEVADGQLCMTPEGGARGCTVYPSDKNVGDTWTQIGTDGVEITITLNAGR